MDRTHVVDNNDVVLSRGADHFAEGLDVVDMSVVLATRREARPDFVVGDLDSAWEQRYHALDDFVAVVGQREPGECLEQGVFFVALKSIMKEGHGGVWEVIMFTELAVVPLSRKKGIDNKW